MGLHLQRQIEVLKKKILTVGSLVEEALARAIQALVTRNGALAASVIEADTQIDHMEVEVEEECLKTLALYQPVAADLRFVVTVLKINNDLERMGDQAKNIAKRVVYLTAQEWIELPQGMREMAAKSQSMVKRCLDALVTGNAELARQVRLDDDDVDRLRKSIARQLPEWIKEHPEQLDAYLKLDNIAKQFERVADMATNVAEDVIYMVQGDIVRHQHLSI